MVLKDEGLVIKSIKYGEKSSINKVLSKEKGLISLIYSRSNKRKTNFFQALSKIEFVYYHSNKASVFRVKEINFKDQNEAYNQNIVVTSMAFFMAEVLNHLILEEEENKVLYSFVLKQKNKLSEENKVNPNFHLHFLVDLLKLLGISPKVLESHPYFDLLEGVSTRRLPSHNNYIQTEKLFLMSSILSKKNILDRKNRQTALKLLIEYIDMQLSTSLTTLKTIRVLEEVLH